MLSVDSRIHSDVSFFGCEAYGLMLQVEEPSPAPADGFRVANAALSPGKHLKPAQVKQQASSDSTDESVDSPKPVCAEGKGKIATLLKRAAERSATRAARRRAALPAKQLPKNVLNHFVLSLDSGNGSDLRKLACGGEMDKLSLFSKDKILLTESVCETVSTELRQRIWSDVSDLSSLLTLHRRNHSNRAFLWGMKESPGYRSKMEDYTCVREKFLTLTILSRATETLIPPSLSKSLRDLESLYDDESANLESLFLSTFNFHFVGVFDGHGGTEVSEKLAAQLPGYVARALMTEERRFMNGAGSCLPSHLTPKQPPNNPRNDVGALCNTLWQTYIRPGGMKPGDPELPFECRTQSSGSEDMDIDMVGGAAHFSCDTHSSGTLDGADNTHPAFSLKEVEECLISAFTQFNDDLPKVQEKTVGSTAIVSLISDGHLVIANVGDSRAVLRRNGGTFRLSRDHKPDQEDEEERIQKSGGRVWDFNGRRVMGLLAMTRAFGDDCLKPFGICAQPEVTIVPRSAQDEFLILACDGLWDVLADDEACHLVQRCFKRAEERQASSVSACRVAASVLFRAAFTKGSNDNISVVVVDLRSQSSDAFVQE